MYFDIFYCPNKQNTFTKNEHYGKIMNTIEQMLRSAEESDVIRR